MKQITRNLLFHLNEMNINSEDSIYIAEQIIKWFKAKIWDSPDNMKFYLDNIKETLNTYYKLPKTKIINKLKRVVLENVTNIINREEEQE